MCLYPRLIDNPKYKANKKNNYCPPVATDKRVLKVSIGCGQCMECTKQKTNQWRIRLMEEIKEDTDGKFMTMTFSNEALEELTEKAKYEEIIVGKKKVYTRDGKRQIIKYIKEKIPVVRTESELNNKIASLAIRAFTERWRAKYKYAPKHWLITELGHTGTERLHIHGIIWTDKTKEEIEKTWGYGWVDDGSKSINKKGYVNEKSINYILKYVTKQDEDHPEFRSKIFCSNGIGKGYLKKKVTHKHVYKEKETNEQYRTSQGIKLNLPIYYGNKLYTEHEKAN